AIEVVEINERLMLLRLCQLNGLLSARDPSRSVTRLFFYPEAEAKLELRQVPAKIGVLQRRAPRRERNLDLGRPAFEAKLYR
ncbi:DNA polymerase II large subunit, partial [Clarias magur]